MSLPDLATRLRHLDNRPLVLGVFVVLVAIFLGGELLSPVPYTDPGFVVAYFGTEVTAALAILQRYLKECVAEVKGQILPSLRKNDDGVDRLQDLGLRLHLLAGNDTLQGRFTSVGRFVDLPYYPWQRERHWLPTTSEGYRLTVDLAAQTVTTPSGQSFAFDITPHRKHCMLNGLDEIGLTLAHADKIRAF